jgi:hypothetical protein
MVHGAARRLLAIPQCCVKKDDLVIQCHSEVPFGLDRIITRPYAQGYPYAYF